MKLTFALFVTGLLLVSIRISAQNVFPATGNVGIGTTAPSSTFQVNANPGASLSKFTFSNVPAANGYIEFINGTAVGGSYYANIRGRSYTPGRPLGIGLTGEAEDVLEAQAAAIMLDGRSKTGSKLLVNNVLAVNSYGINLMMVKADGSVGIGTTSTHGHKLAVNGSGLFTKVKVKAYSSWPDYVFEPNYDLPPLAEVEQHIQVHRHLKGIPSQQEVQNEGIDLGEMDKKLLEKIEELMLYTIAQQKQIDSLIETNKQMQQEIKEIKQSGKEKETR